MMLRSIGGEGLDWKDTPLLLSEVTPEMECIFAIDENGTPSMNNIERNQFFSITGILIHRENFLTLEKEVMCLKDKYWENSFFEGRRVVFHSREVRKKQGPFNPRLIDHSRFLNDLGLLLSDIPINIYSSHIDKINHLLRYSNPYPVYNLALEYMVERFCIELNKLNKKGILILESRGRKEDNIVLKHLLNLFENGNDYYKPSKFECIIGVYFNPKRTNNQKKSYWPLELADLYSYSIHRFIKEGKKDQLFSTFETKITGYPDYDGKGIKIFPNQGV